jgi:hypothetical protein
LHFWNNKPCSTVPAASLDDLLLFTTVARLKQLLARSRRARPAGAHPEPAYRGAGEDRLDAQLLRRTTRRVDTTDAGNLLLARSEAPLRSLIEAFDCLGEETRRARGRLRITMPADFAHSWLDAPIAAFAARHPEIRLELDLTGRVVNLVEEGFDLAIRAGEDVPPG